VVTVHGFTLPDLVLVDTLARLRLEARRLGYTVELRNGCEGLRVLLELVGLSDVVADATTTGAPNASN
jgi:hypothetical protein